MLIKFPHRLASHIVSARTLKQKYTTADGLQLYGLFAILKAFAEKGVINNYRKQLHDVSSISHCSLRTLDDLIYKLEKSNLITTGNGNMYLASWLKVMEPMGATAETTIKFHTINYDESNQKIKPRHLVMIYEELDAKCKITIGLQHSINNTPACINAYLRLYKQFGLPPEFSPENLFRLQQEVFTHGTGAESYDDVFSINPDIERSTRTIQKQYDHQSIRNVAYMRNKLEDLELIKVNKRRTPVFRYSQKQEPVQHISCLLMLASLGAADGKPVATAKRKFERKPDDYKRGSLQKHYNGRRYNAQDAATAWYMPYSIHINPELLIPEINTM